ncbi:DUF6082 family protein [Actinoplanes sp. NPDC023714]|uniref:DUF6082 family protein n=1 Tax=Actinoplanes sp. NPDC023714 TaxID=3154322 RepID=UPI003406A80A
MSVDERAIGRSAVSSRDVFRIVSATLALTAAVVTAGVGIVALIGQRGADTTWQRWSDVGQAFGAVSSVVAAFAVAALVVTSTAQSRSQRDQQTEISLRQQHIELAKMAIDNPHLAAVWPRTTMEDPVTQAQYRYANLLLQHAWLHHKTGLSSREEMISNMRYFFASPTIRDFWEKTASTRRSIYVQGAPDAGMAEIADQIWQECRAVIECSGD